MTKVDAERVAPILRAHGWTDVTPIAADGLENFYIVVATNPKGREVKGLFVNDFWDVQDEWIRSH